MLVRITPARLKHIGIPFPSMVVSRGIPGTELRVGDPYPNPGTDKRARLRAALYFEQRRIIPASAAPAPPSTSKKEKSSGTRKT